MVSKHENVESTVLLPGNCCVTWKQNNPINVTLLLSMQLLVHYYQAVPSYPPPSLKDEHEVVATEALVNGELN